MTGMAGMMWECGRWRESTAPYIADAWCHGDWVRVMRTSHKCQDEGLSEVEGGCSPHQRLLVDERHELQIGMRHWLQLQTPHIPHALRQMLL